MDLFRVRPIYGWGWFAEDGTFMEVPADFSIDGSSIPSREVVIGVVREPGHILDGLNVMLSQCHGACFTLLARSSPYVPEHVNRRPAPCISGYVELISA